MKKTVQHHTIFNNNLLVYIKSVAILAAVSKSAALTVLTLLHQEACSFDLNHEPEDLVILLHRDCVEDNFDRPLNLKRG